MYREMATLCSSSVWPTLMLLSAVSLQNYWIGTGKAPHFLVCLYAGNGNAEPTAEYQRQNDGVIMRNYMDYPVQSMFDHSYMYSQFQSSCALEQT